MAKVMLTLKLHPREASLARVRRKLDLGPADIDEDFGVVGIDPAQNLYAVMVEEKAAGARAERRGVSGPFSNPRIESFAPASQNGRRRQPPR